MPTTLAPAARRIALPTVAAVGALLLGLGLAPLAAVADGAPTPPASEPAVELVEDYQLPTLAPESPPLDPPPAESTAETGRIVGVVLDAVTGEPVPGADVHAYQDATDDAAATLVVVTAGTDTVVSPALMPFPKVSVTVRFADGTVAEDYRVRIVDASSGDEWSLSSVDPSGVVVRSVAPDVYRVEILDDTSTHVGWYDGDHGLSDVPLEFEAVAGPCTDPETGEPVECGELPETPDTPTTPETPVVEDDLPPAAGRPQLDTLAVTGAGWQGAAVVAAAFLLLGAGIRLASHLEKRRLAQ